jgi:hypothetical protein
MRVHVFLIAILVCLPADLPAQSNSQPFAIKTCGDFQALWTADSRSAIQHALALAEGYVSGLEKGGVVDELLPIPPSLSRVIALNPRSERTMFLMGRFLISCRSDPRQSDEGCVLETSQGCDLFRFL